MTEFADQDLSGARFQRVIMRDAVIRDADLNGLQIRGALMHGARMRGVELVNVDIYGELVNVTVNGVEILPLVEAELNRRMPERAKMRPDDAEGFREAWT